MAVMMQERVIQGKGNEYRTERLMEGRREGDMHAYDMSSGDFVTCAS